MTLLSARMRQIFRTKVSSSHQAAGETPQLQALALWSSRSNTGS